VKQTNIRTQTKLNLHSTKMKTFQWNVTKKAIYITQKM